jgi:phospholipase D1/2
MLKAAAERGVKVNIIVYKEVPQALTLNSEHTKHALEALHPNIRVFRHPDHYVSGWGVKADLDTSFQGLSLRTFDLAKFSGDALKALYGTTEDVVLYWAHHEKLCLIDDNIAFMGGLDMCFGRWDTNSHPIADVHPGDIDAVIFPGQDYNNARVYDFEDVQSWENNKLDRTKSSRMGWSDISISLSGPIVNNLIEHFTHRWNFIYSQKYVSRVPAEYQTIEARTTHDRSGYDGGERGFGEVRHRFQHGFRHHVLREEDPEPRRGYQGREDEDGQAQIQLTRSASQWSAGVKTEHSIQNAYIDAITNARHFVYMENQFFITATSDAQHPVKNQIGRAIVDRIMRAHEAGELFQIIVLMPAVPAFAGDLQSDGALGTRAIMEFQYNSISRGGHSIMESLVAAGVDDPGRYIMFYNLRNYDRLNVSDTIGQAERESGVPYEEARQQYDERAERPREECVSGSGYDGQDDRQRGYDRDQGYDSREDSGGEERYRRDGDYGREDHNHQGGYSRREEYGQQKEFGQEENYGRPQGYRRRDEGYGGREDDYDRQGYNQADDYRQNNQDSSYNRYQSAVFHVADSTADSVAGCYMLNGPPLQTVPWVGSAESELNAFVSEELYIHSKVLIADDCLVICGSANLNDRSQLGDHDSEIAVIIEDPTPIGSYMGGQPFTASKFATTLRRQLFRKHLGLLKHQAVDAVDANWSPVTTEGNEYDFGSKEDRLVEDPLSAQFQELWTATARTNTEVFSKVFHPVPNDRVRNWDEYDQFFSRHFITPGTEKKEEEKQRAEGRVDYGHVVAEEFPGGVEEVKEWLGRVRGTLVEMPLEFLVEVEDLAKEGLSLNGLTDELYT